MKKGTGETLLTRKFVEEALKQKAWDVGNSVLYELCARYPKHTDDKVIIAKTWLIGRSYAAAIERRRVKAEHTGDGFYEDWVAPKIREARIDAWFDKLDKRRNRKATLDIHHKLILLMGRLTGLEKRSFASKYLHFHFPEHFFIFDSRARRSVYKLTKGYKNQAPAGFDAEYTAFFDRCELLGDKVRKLVGCDPTPRDLDKVLLWWSRNNPVKKEKKRPLHEDEGIARERLV